jgi:hypothetical protein
MSDQIVLPEYTKFSIDNSNCFKMFGNHFNGLYWIDNRNKKRIRLLRHLNPVLSHQCILITELIPFPCDSGTMFVANCKDIGDARTLGFWISPYGTYGYTLDVSIIYDSTILLNLIDKWFNELLIAENEIV